MRVAPLGAFFADDLERAAAEADLQSRITHTHAEGIAGAVAVAVAAGWMAAGAPWNRDAFWEAVLSLTPRGDVRDGLVVAASMSPEGPVAEAARRLGSGDRVSAQDTVPFVLWCASVTPDDYPATFWRTVEGLGDRDTTCAIAGGVIGARTPPSPEWVELRERLPGAGPVRLSP